MSYKARTVGLYAGNYSSREKMVMVEDGWSQRWAIAQRHVTRVSLTIAALAIEVLVGTLVIVCLGVYLGLGAPAAIAAPLVSANSTPQFTTIPSDPVMTNVDRLLVDIPADYYTIRPVSQLKQQIEAGSVFLIDVRETSEYANGHIKGAINIPLRELSRNLDRIPSDETVVLYCSTGYRTGIGVMALHLLGYDNVRGFPPSYEGWKKAQSDSNS